MKWNERRKEGRSEINEWNGWMNEWMNKWMNESINQWMNQWINAWMAWMRWMTWMAWMDSMKWIDMKWHQLNALCGFVSVIIHQHHSVDGLNIHTSSKNIMCKEQTSKILTKLLQDPVPQLGRRMNPFTCAFASLFPPTYIPIITLNPAFFKLQLDVLWRFPVLECSKKHISYGCGQIRQVADRAVQEALSSRDDSTDAADAVDAADEASQGSPVWRCRENRWLSVWWTLVKQLY